MKHALLLASAGILCGALAPATHAGKGSVYFDMITTGSGTCQAALPAFEGLIRKRPLAIQNEGTAPAFVSCATHQLFNLIDPDYGIAVQLVNFGSSDVDVTCTAISLGKTNTYLPRTVTVPAGGEYYVSYNLNDDEYFVGPFNCNLPPGTGIGLVYPYSVAQYTPPA